MSDFPYLLTENTELSDWIPHDGGECPVSESALVHVDIPGLSLCPAAADGFPWNRVKRYRIIRPKQPDWIPHDGGPCPVPRDARVAVRFRDATERSDLLAAQWDWSRATNAKVGYITRKGSIIGYVWRERHKGGDEDLIKSQDFLRWAVAGKAEGKR